MSRKSTMISHKPKAKNTFEFTPPQQDDRADRTDLASTQVTEENEAFEQQNVEANGLELKKQYGTIASEKEQRLSVLQAKLSEFWARHSELGPQFGRNLANNMPHPFKGHHTGKVVRQRWAGSFERSPKNMPQKIVPGEGNEPLQLKKIKDYPLLSGLQYKLGWTDAGMFGQKPYVMFFTGPGGEHLKFHANTNYLMSNHGQLNSLSGPKKNWTLPTELDDLEFDEFHLTTAGGSHVVFDENGNITMIESESDRGRAMVVIYSFIKVLGMKGVNMETGESITGIDL